MPNMSYCRFENTFWDFKECLEHAADPLTETEAQFRTDLKGLCVEFLADYQDNRQEQEDDA